MSRKEKVVLLLAIALQVLRSSGKRPRQDTLEVKPRGFMSQGHAMHSEVAVGGMHAPGGSQARHTAAVAHDGVPPKLSDISALFQVVQGLSISTPGSTIKNRTGSSEDQIQLFKDLRPCAACKKYVRLGEAHDGGYLMCEELLEGTTEAYSIGIDGFDGWGADLSNRLGITVHQYDCYDTRLPACGAGLNCKLDFHAECMGKTAYKDDYGRQFTSLEAELSKYGHSPSNRADKILKMDIEGGEWPVLSHPENVPLLGQFSQIILELHGTTDATPMKLDALKNLLKDFVVVHVHGNNCCQAAETPEGYVVPPILEVTFVRRGLAQEASCQSDPQESSLDHDNLTGPKNPHLANIKLP